MPQEKKTATRRKVNDAETTAEPQDLRNEKLDEETSVVLDEIACCLAEVEEENDLEAKRAAKAEWEENYRQFAAGEISRDTFVYNKEQWLLKYQTLISVYYIDCCGTSKATPDFSGLE